MPSVPIILRRIWRQRRRLAIVALLCGLCWVISGGGGGPLGLVAVMTACAAAAAAWVGVMPAWRGITSGMAIGFLIVISLGAVGLSLGSTGTVIAGLVLGLALGALRALIMVSLPLGKLSQSVSGRGVVPFPPEKALALLTNDEGLGETAFWHPHVQRIERDPATPGLSKLIYGDPGCEPHSEVEVRLLERHPGEMIRVAVRALGEDMKAVDGGAVTEATFRASPHPEGALVTITERNTLPSALILGMWVDDAPGDYIDFFRANAAGQPDPSFVAADHAFLKFWSFPTETDSDDDAGADRP
ncbi:MAG: hypothetical protein AAF675_18010 [Pseudomonadota bacterium]